MGALSAPASWFICYSHPKLPSSTPCFNKHRSNSIGYHHAPPWASFCSSRTGHRTMAAPHLQHRPRTLQKSVVLIIEYERLTCLFHTMQILKTTTVLLKNYHKTMRKMLLSTQKWPNPPIQLTPLRCLTLPKGQHSVTPSFASTKHVSSELGRKRGNAPKTSIPQYLCYLPLCFPGFEPGTGGSLYICPSV